MNITERSLKKKSFLVTDENMRAETLILVGMLDHDPIDLILTLQLPVGAYCIDRSSVIRSEFTSQEPKELPHLKRWVRTSN